MKTVTVIAAAFCLLATAAAAQDSCKVQADGKNLHGAALTSFAKKCCKDQAAAQKLHGAAATSFTKKCLSDATGT
jgi:hypothetical protein